VVGKLADLARSDNALVLAALHAPRSASFARCDDLLLLAPGGRAAFCGPARDALAWFASAAAGSHACPAHTNAAEFLIDLVSIGALNLSLNLRPESKLAFLNVSLNVLMRLRVSRRCELARSGGSQPRARRGARCCLGS
jgi:hypothetical protein